MASISNTQRNKITKEFVYLRTIFYSINIMQKRKKWRGREENWKKKKKVQLPSFPRLEKHSKWLKQSKEFIFFSVWLFKTFNLHINVYIT